jgi:hypothetical protein
MEVNEVTSYNHYVLSRILALLQAIEISQLFKILFDFEIFIKESYSIELKSTKLCLLHASC